MQFRFAKLPSAAVQDILELEPAQRHSAGPFRCFGCGAPLIPVLGNQRERHFRHKNEDGPPCTSESHLHRVAKTMVLEGFRSALKERRPYVLSLSVPRVCTKWKTTFGITCENGTETNEFDLTKYFDRAELEARVEGFITDVLLCSSTTGERFLIEIAVTHPCERSKIKSGLRIAEIAVQSPDQALALLDGIDCSRPPNRHYNLKTEPVPAECDPNCEMLVTAFFVFRSGKCLVRAGSPKEIQQIRSRPSTSYTKILNTGKDAFVFGIDIRDIIRSEAAEAMLQVPSIKNCYLCRYHAVGNLEAIFCKARKNECGMSAAAGCEIYSIDDDIELPELVERRPI